MVAEKRTLGQTRDSGFQVGARRTIGVDLEEAWSFLVSPAGLRLWLGEIDGIDWIPGAGYVMEDGAHGEVRVFKTYSHLRITWQPGDWPRPSTIQVRVIPGGGKTVVAFHQEHMPGPGARAARKAHFLAALDELEGRWGKR